MHTNLPVRGGVLGEHVRLRSTPTRLRVPWRRPGAAPLRHQILGTLVALLILALGFHTASAQVGLVNGGNQVATLVTNAVDSYTFNANTGDNIVLRFGSTNFFGYLQLSGPGAALLKTAGGASSDVELACTATNSGTFTIQVSSYTTGGHGIYVLRLAQFPESYIVPSDDEGGPMTNGGNHDGVLTLGDLDMWSFSANVGDNIVLRLGSTNFFGSLRLYGPDGTLLSTSAGDSTDLELDYTATTGGTFTVLVSSINQGYTGTYALHLAQFPESYIVPSGDEGGLMTNGGNHDGAITLGDLDMWSFHANVGDNVVLRLGSTNIFGSLRLYGPDGALLKTAAGNSTDWELDYTTTNSGTFTALVCSYDVGATGTYALHLAQFPGAFIVPLGDEGGPMSNGGNHDGAITLGDLDMWSLKANAGDNLVLRLGTTGFDGNLRLYGPTGALLKTAANGNDAEMAYTATNSGTFIALVSSYFSGESGTYELHLAQFPEPFIVPPGDQGGPMNGSASYTGSLSLGDLDIWALTACKGEPLSLRLDSTNFDGVLDLYGPTGVLVKSLGGSGTSWTLNYTPTNCGTFEVLVSSYFSGNTGTYRLTANGLSDLMRLCVPAISGSRLTVNGVGGPPGTNFVLYSSTNVVQAFGLWTPVLTNSFDQYGALIYTNVYNPAPGQHYFRFVLP